jgi:hypothetical protein
VRAQRAAHRPRWRAGASPLRGRERHWATRRAWMPTTQERRCCCAKATATRCAARATARRPGEQHTERHRVRRHVA